MICFLSNVKQKRFYQIKQKLGLDSRTNTAVVKTPRKPSAKPRKTKAGTAAAAAAEAPATPSPSPSPGAGDADNEDDADVEAEAEAATPPKPAPKRRKANTGKAIKVEAVKTETEEIKAETEAIKKEELSEANVKKLRTQDKAATTKQTKQTKNGRTPLPTGRSRVQQRTPSESGGEDKDQADGEGKYLADEEGEEEVRDSITVAVLPSVEVKAEGAIDRTA